jgi:hypothetical protein
MTLKRPPRRSNEYPILDQNSGFENEPPPRFTSLIHHTVYHWLSIQLEFSDELKIDFTSDLSYLYLFCGQHGARLGNACFAVNPARIAIKDNLQVV